MQYENNWCYQEITFLTMGRLFMLSSYLPVLRYYQDQV
jgi:hypothetical protein